MKRLAKHAELFCCPRCIEPTAPARTS